MSFMEKFGFGKKAPAAERKANAPESINQQLEGARAKFKDNWKGLNADVKKKGGWGQVIDLLGIGINAGMVGVGALAMGLSLPLGLVGSPVLGGLLFASGSFTFSSGATDGYIRFKKYVEKYG